MILAAAALVISGVQDNPAPYNLKIVEMCRANLGRKLGRGECSDLADAALSHAGAAARRRGDHPQKDDYVWGDLVYIAERQSDGLAETLPRTNHAPAAGDIVQFRNIKTSRTTRYPDGSWTSSTASYSHHTAIIGTVTDNGRVWKLYEQNSNDRRFVTEGELRLDDITQGYLRVYRPSKP